MYVLISFLHHPTNVFSVGAVGWRFVAFIGCLIYKVLLFWCKYKTIKLYVQYLNVMIFIFVIIVFLSLKSHNALKTWKIKNLRIFWNVEIIFNFVASIVWKSLNVSWNRVICLQIILSEVCVRDVFSRLRSHVYITFWFRQKRRYTLSPFVSLWLFIAKGVALW